jgi:adenylate cyclase
MADDEELTLAQSKAIRKTLVDPKIGKHLGRIVKTSGDGMLVEFASAVDAARCELHRGPSMWQRFKRLSSASVSIARSAAGT